MPSNLEDFFFDVNFGCGSDSVFTLIDKEEMPPLPPIEGYLLQTDSTPLLQTDGTPIALA